MITVEISGITSSCYLFYCLFVSPFQSLSSSILTFQVLFQSSKLLLKFSLCLSLLFPRLLSHLIINALNFYVVNCSFLLHSFFRGFLLLFQLRASISYAFSFCLTFSAFMNLVETVTYCSPKRVFLCESIPIENEYVRCLRWESWI